LDNSDVKWVSSRIRPIKKSPFQLKKFWLDPMGIQIRIHNTDPDPEPKKTRDQKTKKKEINAAQFLLFCKKVYYLFYSP
jgi:hypothetical protein